MQETRDSEGQLRQAVFSAESAEQLARMMDLDIREAEQLIRRRELSQAEYHGVNRHERRKAAKLARKK